MSAVPGLSLPIGPNFSESVDGFFYGNIIAIGLFGIIIVQVWIYINTNTDKWPLQLLVAILASLDLANTCLNAKILHQYLISNFGDLMVFANISKASLIEYLITLIVVLCVEVFFASRVWIIGKVHWIVPVSMVVTALAGTGAGIASMIGQFQNDSLLIYNGNMQKLEVGWSGSLSAVSDIIATAALSWSLSSSKTGIKRTDTLLQKLFQYTITRGLLVTIDQTIFVIIFLTDPEKLWWTPFHYSLSKVYVITMIAMLNARDILKKNDTLINIITDSDMNIGNNSIGCVEPGGINLRVIPNHDSGSKKEEEDSNKGSVIIC
ncbi:hypothetical protein K435DRAFT_719304 [Dendrothele bispora CBS 962.96]|uniref:DUF6534 domain-containing protein n=1 Tax=Dendrothele bispora (strain CBS 962.96) TaxID=1314807 RepID=A0A4S8MCL5_DENBC|nr:hypothetical protein K435DRAFT_719304 [Dendrothele bispora CBS 962.96]